jgi:hypothetical protein
MVSKPVSSCFNGGREQVPAAYANPENWPPFDDSVLKGKARARYTRLKHAIEMYLAFAPMDKVLGQAGVGEQRFARIFRRCGLVQSNGQIAGWSALVAGKVLKKRERVAPLAPAKSGNTGYTGAFAKLLADRPKTAQELVCYLNAFGDKALRPNRVHFRTLHRRFIKICEEQGVTANEYPLNTRDRARRPLRTWIEQVYLPLWANRFIALEHGPEAGKLNEYAQGHGSANAPAAPYSVWILDEVTIDVSARYELPNATGDWEELDLARFFQLRLIDQGGATLCVRNVFAAQACADDLAMLFWDALNGPPEVPQPIEGQTLLEGAGYPATVIPQLRFAMPCVILLDRALAHLADHVQYIATILFGARVIMGPARTPHERAQVESRFSAMARRLLHQLPATTGSGPKDPVRKRAAVPIEGRLRAVELEQVLDAYARNENATPAAASFNIAPLARLKRQIEKGVLQPHLLAADKRKPYFFAKPVRVTVKADRKKGVRPFVNYLYMRYSSSDLAKDYSMEGKTVLLRPDLRNLRTVMLFREDGAVYGPAQVLGSWGQFPHDVRLRRLFGRLKREGELGDRADDQPLEAIFAHLRKKAPRDRKAALQLAHLVEYLTRNSVGMTAQLTQGVREWQQLQEQTAGVAVVPVKGPPVPAPEAQHGRVAPKPVRSQPPLAQPALAQPAHLRLVPPAPPAVAPAATFRPRPSVRR